MSQWVLQQWIDKLSSVENDMTQREFWKFDKLRDQVENGDDIADGDTEFLESLVDKYT